MSNKPSEAVKELVHLLHPYQPIGITPKIKTPSFDERCTYIQQFLDEQLADRDKWIAELEDTLKIIATTYPSGLMMNGSAKSSDHDYIKIANNHMFLAQQILNIPEAPHV